MKKLFFISIIMICFQFAVVKTVAQQKGTIYYDINWKVVHSKDESKFYRIVNFDQTNLSIDTISDYYLNGEIYSRGFTKRIDKFEDSKTTFVGKRKFYSSNGKLSNISVYNNDGIIIGKYTFNENGEVKSISSYNLKNEITSYVIYYDNGKLYQKITYITGTKDKTISTFNLNGNKSNEIIYTDSIPKYDWYLVFDELGNSTKYNIKTKAPYYNEKKSKVFYKDGETYKYYNQNGIIVTMNLKVEKNYGKYYIAYIGISNLTGSEFNFDPKEISVILIKDDIETIGEVLSSNDYMKKVNNKQGWQAALVSFGQGIATIGAGYSTTASVAGVTDGKNSTVGLGVSKTYNSAENYIVNQNAQNNINNINNQQSQIKNELNSGYLKLNTIFNEERIFGQVNIVFKQANKIKITIPINGVGYDFLWDNVN